MHDIVVIIVSASRQRLFVIHSSDALYDVIKSDRRAKDEKKKDVSETWRKANRKTKQEKDENNKESKFGK